MSKSISILSALGCTFIWGTTFIAQDTGMEFIGPYLFNGVRFLKKKFRERASKR